MIRRVNLVLLGADGHGKSSLFQALRAYPSTRGRPRWAAGRSGARSLLVGNDDGTVRAAIDQVMFATKVGWYHLYDPVQLIDQRKVLVSGFSTREGAILVVAADAGITATTRELVRLAALSGLRRLVVYLSRADLVADADLLDLAEMEIRTLLNEWEYFGDEIAVVRGHPDDATVALLHRALDAEIADQPRREDAPHPVRFAVVDSFRRLDRELIQGRLRSGNLAVGQELEIIGGTTSGQLRIASLPVTGSGLVSLVPTGANNPLPGRGDVLATPGTLRAWSRFEAVLYLLLPAEGGRRTPVVPGYRPQFVLNGVDIGGEIAFQHPENSGHPGTILDARVTLVANQRAALETGQRLMVREGGNPVAVGFVTRLLE